MDQKRRKAFKETLQKKRGEILEAVAKAKRHGLEVEPSGAQDIADMASSASTKEFLWSLSTTERETLQLVEAALERLEKRRFGACMSCEEEMNPKRLAAVPWAQHCLRCQEMQEQGLL
jgi:DnaK suppressor protein